MLIWDFWIFNAWKIDSKTPFFPRWQFFVALRRSCLHAWAICSSVKRKLFKKVLKKLDYFTHLFYLCTVVQIPELFLRHSDQKTIIFPYLIYNDLLLQNWRKIMILKPLCIVWPKIMYLNHCVRSWGICSRSFPIFLLLQRQKTDSHSFLTTLPISYLSFVLPHLP